MSLSRLLPKCRSHIRVYSAAIHLSDCQFRDIRVLTIESRKHASGTRRKILKRIAQVTPGFPVSTTHI